MNFTLAATLADKLTAQAARIVFVKVEPNGLVSQLGGDTDLASLTVLVGSAGVEVNDTDTSEPYGPSWDGTWRRNLYVRGLLDGHHVEVYSGEVVPTPHGQKGHVGNPGTCEGCHRQHFGWDAVEGATDDALASL